MSYFIPFSNILKNPIEIQDKLINKSTSIGIAGYKSMEYGEVIATNFIHLLENFSNDTPPENPIEGQLWYKTTDDDKQLHIFNGVEWAPSSGIWKTNIEPSYPSEGDIWINNTTENINVYINEDWLLLSSFSDSANNTGFLADNMLDTTNIYRRIIRFNINKKTLAILSNEEFIPKTFEEGFSKIEAGLTFNSKKIDGISKFHFNGISNSSKNLIIQHNNTEEIIAANKFIRSDTESTLNRKLIVNSNDGVVVGNNSNLLLKVENGHINITSRIEGANLNFLLHEDKVLTVGNGDKIGINNIIPQYNLDINGNVRVTDTVLLEDTTNSLSPESGSLVTFGGIGVLKNVNVRENLKVHNTSTFNKILPLSPTSTIGTETQRFDKIYGNEIHGTIHGHIAGDLSGTAEASIQLLNTTEFSIDGDIESNTVTFNGLDGGYTKIFTSSLASGAVVNRPTVATLDENDEFLIHSNYDDSFNPTSRLCKIKKEHLIADIMGSAAAIPVGTVTRFAGSSPPMGWLRCNGDQVTIASYPSLNAVVGNTYTPPGAGLSGHFYLPNLTDVDHGMIFIIFAGTN